METQRGRIAEASDEEYPATATEESLPPPPTAFPISEFSRISAQLLQATPFPSVTDRESSSPSDVGRNPFGDSNAVSRNSIASTTSESQTGNPFSNINEADDGSFRDDTSSLAPPPEYEEVAGGVGRRFSDAMPLPSYASVQGSSPGKQETGSGASANNVLSPASSTTAHYPAGKAESSEEKSPQKASEGPSAAISSMGERNRAELSAISDAISRVYAASPSLDNQRAVPSSSLPRSGVTDDDTEWTGLSGKLSGLLGLSGERKGKRRESKAGVDEEEETVVVEGKRMSRTMAEDLLQIWDNIDRAHGERESRRRNVLCVECISATEQRSVEVFDACDRLEDGTQQSV